VESRGPRRERVSATPAPGTGGRAAGRSNAQIGAELYLSPVTAEVHVRSIMREQSLMHVVPISERWNGALLCTGPNSQSQN
jgi:hypothetical protein